MFRPLTLDETADKDGTHVQEPLMARVHEILGSPVLPKEDIGLENIPQHDPCEDETQNKQTLSYLVIVLEPMTEVQINA